MTHPLLIGAGIATICLIVFIEKFLKLNSQQQAKISFLRITLYLFHLIIEIAKADWQMVKIILQEKIDITQTLIKIKTKQKFDITKTILANSITLTPGTITVETLETKNGNNEFIVHTLAKKTDNPQQNINELLAMEQTIAKLENV